MKSFFIKGIHFCTTVVEKKVRNQTSLKIYEQTRLSMVVIFLII